MQMIIVMLLLAASPDAAGSTASTETPAPTEATAKPVKAKKICRAGASTGSRLTPKICKTQSEWDAQMGADASKLKSDSGAGY